MLSVAPLDSISISVPVADSNMRGSVVFCEVRSELYLCPFVFGAVRLKYTEPQAATLVFNVPHTVTITMFPILQTVVGTLVMLHSTNVEVTELYIRFKY